MAKYDFSGWATVHNLLCADGRTIKRNAFADDDGATVPLVWGHKHDSPEYVLGHALLENRDQGVYAYCSFNNGHLATAAKEAVKHGDVVALSIFANNLKQRGGDVYHGRIREVSIVLAGANPEAKILQTLMHSDDGSYEYLNEDEGIIVYGEQEGFGIMMHDGMNEDYGAGSAGRGNESDQDKMKRIYESLTEEQKTLLLYLLQRSKEDANQKLAHAFVEMHDTHEQEIEDIQQRYEEQLSLQHDAVSAKEPTTMNEFVDGLSDTQKVFLLDLLGEAAQVGAEERNDNDMAHGNWNMFENNYGMNSGVKVVMSDEVRDALFTDAKRLGSLKESIYEHLDHGCLAHAVTDDEGNEVDYGIADIDYLFPEFVSYTKEPEILHRKNNWVSVVMNGVSKTPYSRVKSLVTDITMDEARAKGYLKSNIKPEIVFKMLKRTVTPCTIQVKHSLDRDDIEDITDFSVVDHERKIMRMLIEEEFARAILTGDGRPATGDPDKIDEDCIIPIMKDTGANNLYAVPHEVTAGDDMYDTAKNIIREAVLSLDDYEGSGDTIFFGAQKFVTRMRLVEDTIGRRLYDTDASIASAMSVNKIVPVMYMDSITNEQGWELAGIIVDLKDYSIGTNKGGKVHFFDDFDIDYNKQKTLMETRQSGALVKPKSAIILWVKPKANNGGNGGNGGNP